MWYRWAVTTDLAARKPDPGAPGYVLLIVPCYNEAHRLDPGPYLQVLDSHPGVDLVFVNDGSTDDTQRILLGLADARPGRIHVLGRAKNLGKGESVREGILFALERSADAVGYWDADLSTPWDALDDFLFVLANRPEIEMVFGARVKLLGREIQRHVWRHYLGRVFATVVSRMLDLPIYDTQCGAKIFRTRESLRAAFSSPFLSRWLFDVELIARLMAQFPGDARAFGRTVYETPLHRWRDVAGSKLSGSSYVRAASDILRIYWRYRGSLRAAGDAR